MSIPHAHFPGTNNSCAFCSGPVTAEPCTKRREHWLDQAGLDPDSSQHDILRAWAYGYLTEGQVMDLLGVDRLQARVLQDEWKFSKMRAVHNEPEILMARMQDLLDAGAPAKVSDLERFIWAGDRAGLIESARSKRYTVQGVIDRTPSPPVDSPRTQAMLERAFVQQVILRDLVEDLEEWQPPEVPECSPKSQCKSPAQCHQAQCCLQPPKSTIAANVQEFVDQVTDQVAALFEPGRKYDVIVTPVEFFSITGSIDDNARPRIGLDSAPGPNDIYRGNLEDLPEDPTR